MPVRFLSDAELARLSGWPNDFSEDDLVTFFTLTSDDLRAGPIVLLSRTGWAPRFSSARCRGWAGYLIIFERLPFGRGRRLADCLGPARGLPPLCWPPTVAGKAAPGVIIGRWCLPGWAGERRGRASASSSTRSSSSGHWSTTPRVCSCSSPGLATQRTDLPSIGGHAVPTAAAARDGARAETYHRLASLLAPPRPSALDRLLDVDASWA